MSQDDRHLLEEIHRRIRSATSLGQTLSEAGVYNAEHVEQNDNKSSNPKVALLNSLAECLSRHDTEVVAVGLIANRVTYSCNQTGHLDNGVASYTESLSRSGTQPRDRKYWEEEFSRGDVTLETVLETLDHFKRSYTNFNHFYGGLVFLIDLPYALQNYRDMITIEEAQWPRVPTSADNDQYSASISDLWPVTYGKWLNSLVRHGRAVTKFRDLSKTYAKGIRDMEFTYVENLAPPTDMEVWQKTIRRVLSGAPVAKQLEGDDMVAWLGALAASNSPGVFGKLTNWKFSGAVHCRATIACKKLSEKPDRNLYCGVSGFCCVLCNLLLNECRDRDDTTNTYLGQSDAMVACSLPPSCPPIKLKKVCIALDHHLRSMLSASYLTIQKKFQALSTGHSHSPLKADEQIKDSKDNGPLSSDPVSLPEWAAAQ
ncbi:MAG: hypothetical protein Q9168_002755 [Polycauliona sp. 1 TL-2023]